MVDPRQAVDDADGLRCPMCGARLEPTADGLGCAACAVTYPRFGDGGGVDLRPPRAFTISMDLELGGPGPDLDAPSIGVLHADPAGAPVEVADLPHHLSPELVSWIPRAPRPGALVLDLGCGHTPNRPLLEAWGYTYVGIDYREPEATYLGDAHALPFRDGLFDLVVTIAALEHFEHPRRAMAEARRVLAPGRPIVGTVAFLEAYHDRSYFHHSPLGVVATLVGAGLEPELVAATPRWSVLDATWPALLPGAPPWLARVALAPLRVAHRAWWAVARRLRGAHWSDGARQARVAGSWMFRARRPAD